MATVEYVRASCRYPESRSEAVHDLDLRIDDGELLVLLGPSGCGKTTALRMLAGLEPVESGGVYIDGRDVTDVPPGRRDVAMVFQSAALSPNETVTANLGYRLKYSGVPEAAVERRVRRIAAELELGDYLDRYPGTLSGGEQQRVAIGRAMIREPKVYLMDEPLSALDAKLRASMRAKIATMQRRSGVTTVYVTHDQAEAMALGDRIAVMDGGVLQQVNTPRRLYERPANAFVAGFVGSPPMNLVPGRYSHGWVFIGSAGVLELPVEPSLAETLTTQPVIVGFRPEHARLTPLGSGLYATVEAVEPVGSVAYAHCDIGGGREHRTLIVRCAAHEAPRPGTAVGVTTDPAELHLFDSVSGLRL